ncbi:PP2C family protein-serine/threonine phosphatase [Pseudorhodoferax sp.]|uniref:PP2C family protein-serine/threonine phosphatase n=1 Tax=Pseudorhodoferax sp. TaxID=1993553 RepID=UPI002DD62381|nr:PP2C family serine/threonine-protein phosphatase [Pseudorhodoferax sp.]
MPTAFQIDVHPFTDRGQRDYQEDFFYTDPPAREGAPWLGAVADGMGGHVGGDIASRAGILALKQGFEAALAARLGTAEALAQAATRAHEAVLQAARNANALGNMGATLAAFAVDGTRLHWCSAGDSRIYLCRAGQIEQLTRDFTLAEDMRSGAQQGAWSEADIQANPQRNALTSFMGTDHWRHHDGSRALEVGDVVVACSDGVYGSIGNDGIRDACAAAEARLIAEDMLRRVLAAAKPHQDNSTAVVVRIAGLRTGHALARHEPAPAPAPPGGSVAKWAGLACVAALATAAGVLVLRSGPVSEDVAGPAKPQPGASGTPAPAQPPAPAEPAPPVPAALPALAPAPPPPPPAALRAASAPADPGQQEQVKNAVAAFRLAMQEAGMKLTPPENSMLDQIEKKSRPRPTGVAAPKAPAPAADANVPPKKKPTAPIPPPAAPTSSAPTQPQGEAAAAKPPAPTPPAAPGPAPVPGPTPAPGVQPAPPPVPPAPPPSPSGALDPPKARGGNTAPGELGPSPPQ